MPHNRLKGGWCLKAKILIVEDQFIEANRLRSILEIAEYQVCTIAHSFHDALNVIRKEGPDLVLLDIFLQGNLTGIDLAAELQDMGLAFVYISANSNRQVLDAAKATKPYGFLVKPFREKDVLVMLDVAWYLHEQRKVKRFAARKLAQNRGWSPENSGIIGESDKIKQIIHEIQLVGNSGTSVLILGESGTGKEMVARALHENSDRREGPFIIVNCAALPVNLIESELFGHEKGAFTGAIHKRVGKFEMANDSTIFLDEIGELPLDMQVKFLRVLQEREIEPIGGKPKKVNLRIIAATNRDLEEEVSKGRFRVDLYYRLNVFPITMPPLRSRKEDIMVLADHFLAKFAHRANKQIKGFSPAVERSLKGYNWPGNVRELENLIERSIFYTTGKLVEKVSLPLTSIDLTGPSAGQIKTAEENERDHILAALQFCNWKISGANSAAEVLNVNPSTLTSRMKRLGIVKQ